MSEPPMTPSVDALEWSLIRARGNQAIDFLQGQLTQDLDANSDGPIWSLLLNPDSTVVSALHVTRVDGGVDLVVPRALAEATLSRLRRFLLRVDCTLEVVDVTQGPFATTEDLVTRGWPGENEFARSLSPHAFGDAVVSATVSFTKGCYTGQELVARVDSRGAKVPWRLVRAHGPDVAAIEAVLASHGPEGPRGVTTAVPAGDAVVALGVAHRSLADGLEAGVLVETL